MSQTSFGGESYLVLHILIQIARIVRVLLCPHRARLRGSPGSWSFIDAATEHVHLTFYIWLPDNNGRKK